MFDFTLDSNTSGENSEIKFRTTGKNMNSLKPNILNSPKVLTGMSHEMRTHMNAIVAFSFLMKDNGCSDEDRDEFSSQILSSCEQLIGLFDSFLDSAIIDTGNSNSELQTCKIDTILDEVLPEYSEELKKDGNEMVEFITEIPSSNMMEVYIDKSKIFRVINSLFQSSVKNTKSGYIKIGYFYKEENLTFYVLDSGQGYFKCKEFLFTEDLNESLKLHNDTHTAINLTLAKKIIQMLGGTINLECNGLTGTGIYFTIPVKTAHVSDININKYTNTMIAI